MNARRALIVAAVLLGASLATFVAARVIAAAEPAKLAAMLPDGALLYLESPDFQSIISDWNQSPEKQSWLKSDNYAVFSRSRLFGRLSQAQSEFATAAGLPPDMQLLAEVAGKQSAFAWYDIGKLEFVYLTRMPSSGFSQSRLWQARGKFEHREATGVDFYVRADPQSSRTVAFAAVNDWVVLGTREDLVADTLTLIKGQKSHSLSDEAWFVDATAQAKASGDLRMVLNLEKIVPSPYFRSYWVQQNITEMKQYRAAISDLYRDKAVYREERVLLRRANADHAPGASDVSALAAAVTPDAGFYQAVASPDVSRTVAVLKEKLLDPRPADAVNASDAPNPVLTQEQAGQATDLDTHIDQAPVENSGNGSSDPWDPLKTALEADQIDGLLTVESSATQAGSIFSGFHFAVVLSAATDWQVDPLKAALSSGLESRLTASHLGVGWSQEEGYQQCDGLLPLFLSAQGKYLILANDRDLLLSLKTKLTQPFSATEAAVYVAGFNHGNESAGFAGVTTFIDRANQRGGAAPDSSGQSPAFFSGNIASLSQTFSAMTAEKITVRDAGERVTQTVTYQWK
jgi:hypothetical protein